MGFLNGFSLAVHFCFEQRVSHHPSISSAYSRYGYATITIAYSFFRSWCFSVLFLTTHIVLPIACIRRSNLIRYPIFKERDCFRDFYLFIGIGYHFRCFFMEHTFGILNVHRICPLYHPLSKDGLTPCMDFLVRKFCKIETTTVSV